MKISLGNLYTDGGQTILDLFNSTLTDSEYLLDVLGQSSIQLTKVCFTGQKFGVNLINIINYIL